MGVPSQLSRCRLPRQLQDAALTPVAERGAEGHSSWFEVKSRHRERFYYYKKKNKVIYLGTSLRCHIYPSKRQRSRQVTADMSETCTGGERGGGVSEAIEQQHENLNVWGVFLKLKVILRQPLSVFHCLSRTPLRSISLEKLRLLLKCLIGPLFNASCQ